MTTREDELLALEAIYDSSTFLRDEGKLGGQLKVTVDLLEPLAISSSHETRQNRHFRHLPPLVILFKLPEDYPETSPPSYSLSCPWLSLNQLSALCAKLDAMWMLGEVILFEWVQYLAENTLEILGCPSELDLAEVFQKQESQHHGSALQSPTSQEALWLALIEHDESKERRLFNESRHECAICCAEKLGIDSMQMRPCEHVYCRACVKQYFELLIRDGMVTSLTCLETKCDSPVDPSEVKELVDPALFARYDRLLLQGSLDGMSDIVYCPRKACQCAVMRDKQSMMGVCPRCEFAFCSLCNRTWHGVAPCQFRKVELRKLKGEYEKAAPAERAFLEHKYGLRTIRRAVEEIVSEDWIEEYTKQCPACLSNIQKMDGCNKMTCMKCKAHFCWICMRLLDRNDPYKHFSASGSECFNLLFRGMGIEDDDFEFLQ
eukprot:m.1643 g.1643  ORF g.1643 m.1643 type:complete len:433 (+) comp7583_c0_seq2:24-1322(+)